MAELSDRAAAVASYVQAVLDDREVRDALGRATSAARGTYRRARAKTPAKAVKDKRLRRRAQQAAIASWQLIAAIEAAQTPRKRHRVRRVVFVLAGFAGAYGAYLLSNGDGREAVRRLMNHDASSQSSNVQ